VLTTTWYDLVLAVALGGVATLVLPMLSLRITAFALAWAGLFAYEWGHYLIHTSYRPRSRWFRALRRAHLLHHFRNDHYWFGVIARLADAVLHTSPDPARVDRSTLVGALDRDVQSESA
jgi:sterol desaturase/sphingolipid hydroxylase (fatty acid hydroxylase superfamily)